MACTSLYRPLSHGVNRSNASVVLHCYNVLLIYIRASRRMITCACARDKKVRRNKNLAPGLAHVCDNNYDVLLYKAAFLLAFHGFLRISEFAVTSQRKQERMLRMSDVKVAGHAPRRRIELFLRASKTDQRGDGCTISIPEVDSEICPRKGRLTVFGNASERWRGFLLLIRHSSNH